MDITDRQKQLLLTIIGEFIETAEAVGSLNLQSKYGFKVSPATIRNEMAELVGSGYLLNRNASGGRVPTLKGWRYFIEDLLSREVANNINVVTKEEIKNELNRIKFDKYQLIRKAIGFLSKLSNNPAFAILDGEIVYAGLSEMVNIPEFRNIKNLQKMLEILEDYYSLSKIMNTGNPENDLSILFGEETDIDSYKEFTVVFTEIRLFEKQRGYIAVIGPNRMRYDHVISAVKYLSQTIKYLVKNW